MLGYAIFEIRERTDMQTDRQTDRQIDTLIAIFLTPSADEGK